MELDERVQAIKNKRKFRTVDIVERLAVITAQQVVVENYPQSEPKTVFNPSFDLTPEGLKLYARISVGYYTYTSSIIELFIPFEDLSAASPHTNKTYPGKLTIIPDNKFDFWGVEDPRYYRIEEREFITYCGRTVNYFQTHIRVERTLPVTAVRTEKGWRKVAVFRMPEEIRTFLVSDKDAFLVRGKELMLFHRPHMLNEKFYLNICRVPEEIIQYDKFKEVEIGYNITVMEQCDFEFKIGWGTPPIKINDEHLVLLHGVDRDLRVYRVFAALITDEGQFCAVTPHYIMEPKEIYEIYGDRPFVVFPCGAARLGDDLYISYGGADSVIGIGKLSLPHLMDTLEANRIQ
jgi:predicted GH43/DUF377 family glycosyl hydrolase